MIFTDEQIIFVINVDSYSQDHDPATAKKFETIYSLAPDTSYGWHTIAEKYPYIFAQALVVALSMKNNL